MQGKTLIKTLLITALILWALYALWPSYKLWTMAPDHREQMDLEGKLVPLIEKSIRMGLDLQGGMRLTLEVDVPKLVENLARNKDDRLEELLAQTQQDMNESLQPFFTVLAEKFQEAEIPLSRYWGERGDSDSRVMDELEKEAREAMDRSHQILTNRIDQFGVSEPSIQRMGNRRIVVELPGISDPDQARSLIGQTALLEFKMLKDSDIYSDVIRKIDRAVAGDMDAALADAEPAESAEDSTQTQEEPKESQDKVVSVSELFGEEQTDPTETAESDTSLLVDEQMFQENPFMALLRSTRQTGHDVSVPLENVRTVSRILAREDIQPLIPPDAAFYWASEDVDLADKTYRGLYLLKKDPEITGQYLLDARVTIGSDVQSAGRPEVHFTLNRAGARIFSRVTGANVNKYMAIVLDSKVVSSPRIQDKIHDGRSRITGIPDMDEAKMVAIVLRAGAMPAPVQIIEERTVGPSLGQDSIKMGAWSAAIGMGLIILFMIVYYRMAGSIADFALILNIVLLMAVLAQFHFTLTLPGVAGIVLTIGMAVDANVLVFERIREELRTGKTVKAAIDAGYSRAFRTILDANVTTLLTALVLYQFGTGPLRGFAVTLSIGILVSMFTALVVTRLIFTHITARRTLTKLSI